MARNGRQAPPEAIHNERSYLGVLLGRGDVLDNPEWVLSEDDFAEPTHRKIFKLAQEYRAAGRGFTPEAMFDYLPEQDAASRAVRDLLEGAFVVAKADNVPHYVAEIRRAADERAVHDLRLDLSRAVERGTDPDYIADIERRLDNAKTSRQPAGKPKTDPYIKFPVTCLPGRVAQYVEAAAKAIGCDPSYIALPLLCCLARAVGNSRVIRLKHTWTEPAIIWAAIVGKSGTHKTPAIAAATKTLKRRQAEAIKEYQESIEKHEQAKADYDRAYANSVEVVSKP